MHISHGATFGVAALLVLATVRQAQGAGRPVEAGPISLQEIAARGVAGRLGPRLGTIMEITGAVVANASRAKAEADLPFVWRVDGVDGHPLKEALLFPVMSAGTGVTLAAPAVGDSFHVVGYETGGFGGAPDGEFKYVPAYPTTGFGFATRFVVLAVK